MSYFEQKQISRTSLIARFCQSMSPSLWEPEPKKVREIKVMVQCLDALIEMRQQEINRLEVADTLVVADLKGHIEWLSHRIDQLRTAFVTILTTIQTYESRKNCYFLFSALAKKRWRPCCPAFLLLTAFQALKSWPHSVGLRLRNINLAVP